VCWSDGEKLMTTCSGENSTYCETSLKTLTDSFSWEGLAEADRPELPLKDKVNSGVRMTAQECERCTLMDPLVFCGAGQ